MIMHVLSSLSSKCSDGEEVAMLSTSREMPVLRGIKSMLSEYISGAAS